MLLDALEHWDRFAVFGAQVVAYGAYRAVERLRGRTPECFAVSRREGNPAEIGGVPVLPADTLPRDTPLVVGVTELVQKEALPYLRALGFRTLYPLTQHEEHLLMSAYFDSLGLFPALDADVKHDPADLALYEARNHRDKPLERPPALLPFERPIQAGAALTGVRVARLTDDAGDNISAKNREYCEMTAAYWIWKHDAHAWTGLEHYRRHLLVTPEALGDGIDAVLPLPYLCYPNAAAQLRRFIGADVLEALYAALRALHPEEYEAYRAILEGPYQYTYNLVCAKKPVYDGYCAWFFGVTEYMEGLTDMAPALRGTRALSYAAEALTNLYFMRRRDELRLRHAEKAIFV